MPRPIRIGSGAGYSGDRIEPAVELAERGALDYLVFECLAERTIALAQQARATDPTSGYDPWLVARMAAVLPACRARGVRIITNMGAANPVAAAARVEAVARTLGLPLTIAAVSGDDVLDFVVRESCLLAETGTPVAALGSSLLSANAYIGAEPIVAALTRGADVVITGRAADPSLFVAAQVHAFGWASDQWPTLGQATVVGHLLECAGQVTGGYFADPETTPVPDLARLGFPIAEVTADGSAVITKVDGSGGQVTPLTCKAQLVYELHDPAAYLTPDVTADFRGVRFQPDGPDRVRVTGGTGGPRPEQLKVSVGYRDGCIGIGEMAYAGPGAAARAQQAAEIVAARFALTGFSPEEIRYDLIGVNALQAGRPVTTPAPAEVRLRVAARVRTVADARRVGQEVESLYLNGPAGGGGATTSVREVVAIGTTFVPRSAVQTRVTRTEVR